MAESSIRPFLMAAVERLEQTLQRNDTKGCWLDLNPWDLWQLLQEEYDELAAEWNAPEMDCPRSQAEALDLALCALFIWSAAGGCPDFGRRGGLNSNEGAASGARRQGGYRPE